MFYVHPLFIFGSNAPTRMKTHLLIILLLLTVAKGLAQEQKVDSNKVLVARSSGVIHTDTSAINNAALDIGKDRGLFIRTEDGEMQLRILGSVRYLVLYDDRVMPTKNTLNTYEIPTGDLVKKVPNYYNGLNQSRLGFEITRRTEKGNVFIRLETDFAGSDGFRIRHAYGQFRNSTLGQTWSLFSHVNALPKVVDFTGPTGSIVKRTPQLRYSIPEAFRKTNLAIALEYLTPDLNIPDSLTVENFQLIPDITARLDRSFDWGAFQLSAIVPVLSGWNEQDDLAIRLGWGISGSAVLNSWAQGKWYLQGVMGQAINRYFNDLSGRGFDLVFDPDNSARSPFSFGWYDTYEHSWRSDLSSNLTFGWLQLENFPFKEEGEYSRGYTLRANTFWHVVKGATVGAEAVWGKRINENSLDGNAVRINLLFYYDF